MKYKLSKNPGQSRAIISSDGVTISSEDESVASSVVEGGVDISVGDKIIFLTQVAVYSTTCSCDGNINSIPDENGDIRTIRWENPCQAEYIEINFSTK